MALFLQCFSLLPAHPSFIVDSRPPLTLLHLIVSTGDPEAGPQIQACSLVIGPFHNNTTTTTKLLSPIEKVPQNWSITITTTTAK